jgi:hypothetical protein
MLAIPVLTVALLSTAHAQFGEPGHLKCYKTKDDMVLKGPKPSWLALDGEQFGLEACRIVGGFRLLCVPVSKEVTQPPSRRFKNEGVKQEEVVPQPLTLIGPTVFETDKICYKIKCDENLPVPPNPSQVVMDQFGTRKLEQFKPFILCGPAMKATGEDVPCDFFSGSDIWEFPVSAGQTVTIRADTLDAATAADIFFSGTCGDDSFFANDEIDCTFPPPASSCPHAEFTATQSGFCSLRLGTFTDECNDPVLVNYALGVTVDGVGVSPLLVEDDVPFGLP